MKFSEWLEVANKLAREHPEYLDLPMVTAKDDEGNGFTGVIYALSVGYADWVGERSQGDYFCEVGNEDYPDGEKPNAVCLN